MQLELISGRDNDVLLGSRHKPVVVAGECAFQRCGLTSHLSNIIQAWTLRLITSGIYNPIAMWYFSPFADKFFDTKPSIVHPNILEPTRERAIIEYIIFHDYFDEGILIEGLSNYLYENDDNPNKLFLEAEKFHCPKKLVDYWIKEAREDCEV